MPATDRVPPRGSAASDAAGRRCLEPVFNDDERTSSQRRVLGYALRLRGVRVSGHFGVSDAERASAQELLVAVDLELGGEHYPRADELDLAVDYSEIVRAAAEGTRGQGDRLLETFALRVARRLGEQWPSAAYVRVAVTKAAVPTTPAPDEACVEVILGAAP